MQPAGALAGAGTGPGGVGGSEAWPEEPQGGKGAGAARGPAGAGGAQLRAWGLGGYPELGDCPGRSGADQELAV